MKRAFFAFVVGLVASLAAGPSVAQFPGAGLPGASQGAGPEPSNNREMAMSGRQIVGLGGKCLQWSGLDLVMNACQADLITQRFVFANGRLTTAGVIVTNDLVMGRPAWAHACVSMAQSDRRVFLGSCRPAMGAEFQAFTFNGREIRGQGNQCLDVAGNRTDNGAPVIYWGCHGEANQQWVWR